MSLRDLPQRIYSILKEAAQEFSQDMAARFGAALSFYTLFSLVPLLFLIVAVVGFVSSDSVLLVSDCSTVTAALIPDPAANPLDQLILQVNEVAGSTVADEIAQLTCQAGRTRQQALWIGIVLAAFSGSVIFRHIQGVLNFIFSAPPERTRGVVNSLITRGIAVAWAGLLAVMVLVPLVAVAGVTFIRDLVDADWLKGVLGVAVPISSLFVLVAAVSLTFQWLPRVEVPAKAAHRGGLFTAVIGLIGAYFVGLYLGVFGVGGALGAVGGVAILLFFFNLMWLIYLFGAEVTKVYARRLAAGETVPASPQAPAPLVGGMPARQSPLAGGIMAFLIGLVTGWAARRRP